jgi:predicted peroxiredoxin
MKNTNGYPDTLITLTSGKQDRGTRATLAFSWGCAALAMGQKVTLFMTMEGTVWATRGAMKNVIVGGFEPLETYLEQFQALGGELLVCAPCSEYYCSIDGSQLTGKVIQNAELSGLATIVSRIGKETKTVTF